MRYIKYALIAAFALALATVSLANRGMVTVTLIPEGLAGWFAMNPSVQLPLFIVIFISMAVGVAVGFFWEWFREYKHRAEAATEGREKRRLQREVDRLKDEKHEGKDEVIALLDKAS